MRHHTLPSPEAEIVEATPADAAEILALQRLAYRSEAELNDDWSIPPLTQTLAELMAQFDSHLFLKLVARDRAGGSGRIVGSVRAVEREGVCHIGRLIVHPDQQNRGLGTRLMRAIEARFPAAQRYELFTSERSARNLHLYAKLGYRETRRQRLNEKTTLVYLEKVGAAAANGGE